jgi:hypothetical protein
MNRRRGKLCVPRIGLCGKKERHFAIREALLPAAASAEAPLPVYLKSGENRYIEFGGRKFYPAFVPKVGP